MTRSGVRQVRNEMQVGGGAYKRAARQLRQKQAERTMGKPMSVAAGGSFEEPCIELCGVGRRLWFHFFRVSMER